MTMAQSSAVRQASASSSLTSVALLLPLLSSVLALSVVPSSINANGKLGAHHVMNSARPPFVQLSTTQTPLVTRSPHPYMARKPVAATSSSLFANASNGRFSSSSQRTQQKKFALLSALLSKISYQISTFHRSIHSTLRATAIISLLLFGILRTSTPPAQAAAARIKEAATKEAVSSPKFLLPKLPSARAFAAFATYGSVALGIGAVIWVVVRFAGNNWSNDKDGKDSGNKSVMKSNGMGIASSSSGVPKGEDPLPLSDEWIQQQLKLAEELKKKPHIPKDPPSVTPLSSEWIEQQMNNLENEKKSQVSKKPAVDEPPRRMTPPPPPL